MNTAPIVSVPLPASASAPAAPAAPRSKAGAPTFGQLVDKAQHPAPAAPASPSAPGNARPPRPDLGEAPPAAPPGLRPRTAPAPGHSRGARAADLGPLTTPRPTRVVSLPSRGAHPVAVPVTHLPRRWKRGRIPPAASGSSPALPPPPLAAPAVPIGHLAPGSEPPAVAPSARRPDRGAAPLADVVRPPTARTRLASRSAAPVGSRVSLPVGGSGAAGAATAASGPVPPVGLPADGRVPTSGAAGPSPADAAPVNPTPASPPTWSIRVLGGRGATQQFQLVPPTPDAPLHVTLDGLTHAIHLGLPQEWEPVAADLRANPGSLLAAVGPSGFAPQQVRVTVQSGGSTAGHPPAEGERGQPPGGAFPGGARRRRRQ